MINIAICDDDLVFASKIEAMLLQISKKQMIKMNIEVFSDGSELWDDISFGKINMSCYIWILKWSGLMV